MRGIAIVSIVLCARVAAAEPPGEDVAIRAASAWFAAGRAGDGAALAKVSARTVRVQIDQYGCHVDAVAKSRAALRRVAKQLKACSLMSAPPSSWHASQPPVGDTRVVGFATMDESFVMVGVTVDAKGRVTDASMTTSYGGEQEAN
ncbi:MAG TPA: hypothetical protein VL463_28300 [Kofleriaceae bacterium]|nr:hypothetical protein [Kofleriaceae bacterium]